MSSYTQELSVGPVSSTQIRIEKDVITFDGKSIKTAEITGIRYQKTENRINGIRISTLFQIDLGRKEGKDFEIKFVGTAGSTSNMERQYSKIIDLVWKYAGNRILNEIYKVVLEGGNYTIGKCRLEPKGVVILKSRLFGKDTETLVKWEDIDYQVSQSGHLFIQSLGDDGTKTEMYMGTTMNAMVLYSLLRWLYEDSDRIAAIYQANGIEF